MTAVDTTAGQSALATAVTTPPFAVISGAQVQQVYRGAKRRS